MTLFIVSPCDAIQGNRTNACSVPLDRFAMARDDEPYSMRQSQRRLVSGADEAVCHV